MSHVIRNGLALTTIGAIVGASLALLANRALSQLLFQVSPLDAVSFSSAAVLLALTSIGACLPAAWRASHVDPVRALRNE
jgi:ABC-type lipoprotein release transport system permease subunit